MACTLTYLCLNLIFVVVFAIFVTVVLSDKFSTLLVANNDCGADIDTLPLLAWHKDMLQHVEPSTAPLLKYQQYLFFPILCFARMSWAQQSFAHSRLLSKVELRGSLELSFIVLHYAVVLGMPMLVQSWLKTISFFLVAQVRELGITSFQQRGSAISAVTCVCEVDVS